MPRLRPRSSTAKPKLERQHNLAEAEANRIRVTALADSERMKFEAAVLKSNPMLIQKIIAERLSDKLQIMMVPVDGKNFFANDVFRSAFSGVGPGTANADDGKAPTPQPQLTIPPPSRRRTIAAVRRPGSARVRPSQQELVILRLPDEGSRRTSTPTPAQTSATSPQSQTRKEPDAIDATKINHV